MKIACIQPEANSIHDYRIALSEVLSMIDEAGEENPNLIVVPECAYPAYFLGVDQGHLRCSLDDLEEVWISVANRAKKYSCYIAFGYVEESKGKMYNSGLLFNPEGKIISRARKSFLWHFDSNWFSKGKDYEVIDTEFGRWGMIICADGRMPEIPRALALQNVDLIIDLANLTSTGKDKTTIKCSMQFYVKHTRNRKSCMGCNGGQGWKIEASTITYAGRSSVISPDGEIMIEASPYEKEIIYADIDICQSKNKRIENMDAIKDRQVHTYTDLVSPINELPISKVVHQSTIPKQMVFQGGTIQFLFRNKLEFLEKVAKYIECMENQGVEVITLPESEDKIQPEEIQRLINKSNTLIFYASSTDGPYRSMYALRKEKVEGTYHKIHLNQEEQKYKSGHQYCVIEKSRGNIGFMLGEEGLFPEAARILTLKGADYVIWINHMDPTISEKIARTRAAEIKYLSSQ